MKRLFTLFTIAISFHVSGQNFNCLQFGPKRYFINGNHYVRGMRIDSVRTAGSDTIYYPYHTARFTNYFSYYGSPDTDLNGASWLGKNVVQKADGTFIFDNKWDTVFIKTQAHTGDSWMFFADTTPYSYKATVVSESVASVLGTLDSIKTITITADSAGVPHTIDPVNNFQLVLSKNHGFVQIFDLYTFPCHRPDTMVIDSLDRLVHYVRYIDYYLDVLLNNLGTCDVSWSCYDNPPDTTNSIFHLFPFYNPTRREIFDFSPGDVYESDLSRTTGPATDHYYTVDSILTRSSTSSAVSYGGPQHQKEIDMVISGTSISYLTYYSSSLVSLGGDSTRLIDSFRMPEENYGSPYLLYYNASDPLIVPCDTLPSYTKARDYQAGGFGYDGTVDVPSHYDSTFCPGFGLAGIDAYDAPFDNTVRLSYCYYKKGTKTCGAFVKVLPDAVSQINKTPEIIIVPNPAADRINITANRIVENIMISVYDFSGRCFMQTQTAEQNNTTTINTSQLPNGLYMLTITDQSGLIHKQKISILH
jgi:hypothetical protein